MPASITSEEIKGIRETYGLSQRAFATLLGIGPASIARYESGAQPTKANANLIMAARNPRFMMECMERDGSSLTEAQRKSVQRVYYAYVELPPEDGEDNVASAVADDPSSQLNEAYDLTLRQEVLNEQAANLACDLMRYMINANIDARDETNPTALLLANIFEIKQLVYTRMLESHEALDDVRGFLKYLDHYVLRLNETSAVA